MTEDIYLDDPGVDPRASVTSSFCTTCGEPVDGPWQFCRRCGVPLSGAAGRTALRQSAEAPSAPPKARWLPFVAALLLLVGVGLGVASLFPTYMKGGTSLASTSENLWFNLPTLAGWMLAGMLLTGVRRTAHLGCGLAIGVTLAALGWYLRDWLDVAVYHLHPWYGFGLGTAGYACCFVGALMAAVYLIANGAFGLRGGIGSVVGTVLGGVCGVALGFGDGLPWGHVTATWRDGTVHHVATLGSILSEPTARAVAEYIAIGIAVLIPMVAGAWRRPVVGVGLTAGVVFPWASAVISGAIGFTQPVDPAQYGTTAAHLQEIGTTLHGGLEPGYFLATAAVVGLALLAIGRGLSITQPA